MPQIDNEKADPKMAPETAPQQPPEPEPQADGWSIDHTPFDSPEVSQ